MVDTKSRVIAPSELEEHGPASAEQWVAINGMVYNVTKFGAFHPGGTGVLRRACGTDATRDFAMVHAPSVLGSGKYEKLVVGVLEGVQKTKKKKGKQEEEYGTAVAVSSLPFTDHYWMVRPHTLKAHPLYTPSHFTFQKNARAFVEKEIIPYVGKWDEARGFPTEIYNKAFQAGLYGAYWPAEHGGTPPANWDPLMGFILNYEMGRIPSGGFQASFASIMISLPPILKHGSDELKRKYGRLLIEGKAVGALCITEPWAGSDVSRIRCTAVANGDHYVVNGEKKFITNGMAAKFLTVAVRTKPPNPENIFDGISLLVIESDLPGVSRRRLDTQGWWGSNTAYINFEDVCVPKANLIGEEHVGFKYVMSNFNTERFAMCGGIVASCHVLLAEAIRYAKVRRTFGSTLMEHQVIRHKIADMAVKTEALYALCEQIAYHMCQKVPDLDLAPRIALCKVNATKTFELCARETAQIFGGNSYQRGGQGEVVERLYRDVRVQAIGGGSEEIMLDLGVRMSKL